MSSIDGEVITLDDSSGIEGLPKFPEIDLGTLSKNQKKTNKRKLASSLNNADEVIIVDDYLCVPSSGNAGISRVQTRQSLRLQAKRNVIDDVIIVGDDQGEPLSRSAEISHVETRKRSRPRSKTKPQKQTDSKNKRRNVRNANRTENCDVITLEEDYPVLDCHYFPEKDKEEDNKNVEVEEETSSDFTLFVVWNDRVTKKFTISKYSSLREIFDFYAAQENLPITEVCLVNECHILTPKHTPETAGFKQYELLRCFKATMEQNFEELYRVPDMNPDEKNPNVIELKVLLKNKKHPLMIRINKDEPFKSIVVKCAAKLDCHEEEVVVIFDGDKVDLSSTPNSLEMCDGDCIEAHIKTM
uniref:Rad60/SUMO-like domain-containing protein n=1 Tax=Clastoptera arizonana TaxID=38151 RepID=A0A1B6C2S9_9HEMI